MALSLLFTALGLVLMSLTMFDLFMTVLHPQVESFFSSRLQTVVWYSVRLAARGLRGRARHRLMGLALPLMIVTLVAVWLTMLLVSFALIYAAWINTPGAFRSPGQFGELAWTDAIYFSGVTLGTIGYGDFQPVHPLLRLASIIEGFGGIGVLSMSIAYMLEVYPALQRASVLAVLLNEETAGQANGLPLLARYLRKNNFEALAGLMRTVNLELLSLSEAHRRLPVLHYSHPVDIERSFLRTLLVVRNLVAALRFGLAGAAGREWSDDPRVQDLEDSLFYTLYTLGSSLHLTLTSDADNSRRVQEITEEFDSLVRHLDAMGLPTPSDGPSRGGGSSQKMRAQARYLRFYLASDVPLLSYLRNSGYSYAEATQNAVRPEKLVLELEAEALEEQEQEQEQEHVEV